MVTEQGDPRHRITHIHGHLKQVLKELEEASKHGRCPTHLKSSIDQLIQTFQGLAFWESWVKGETPIEVFDLQRIVAEQKLVISALVLKDPTATTLLPDLKAFPATMVMQGFLYAVQSRLAFVSAELLLMIQADVHTITPSKFERETAGYREPWRPGHGN